MARLKSPILYVVFAASLALMGSAGARAGIVPPDSTIFAGLKGTQLMDSLEARFRSSVNLGYNGARDTLYGVIDRDSTDSLFCIYSGHKISMIKTGPYVDSTNRAWAYYMGMDCEHTWPQSSFNQSSLPRADMHHLYACQRSPVNVNGDRGDSPFREIPDIESDYWYWRSVKTPAPPDLSIRDNYSELDNAGGGSWEVREHWAGNVSRGIFYFYNMYRNSHPAIITWWQGQLPYIYDLLAWHVEDPADAREISRTKKIATYQQGKVNPYILDSTLVRRAYFPNLGVTSRPAELAFGSNLLGNRPNPFRQRTEISYQLSESFSSEIVIYNVLGREVDRRLLPLAKGQFSLTWDGRGQDGRAQPPGIYFYQFRVNGQAIATKKMIMIE